MDWKGWIHETLCIPINPNYGCVPALMHKKWRYNGSESVCKIPYITAIASNKPVGYGTMAVSLSSQGFLMANSWKLCHIIKYEICNKGWHLLFCCVQFNMGKQDNWGLLSSINSLVPGRYSCNLWLVIFKFMLRMNILSISYEIVNGGCHNISLMVSQHWFR